MRIRSLRVSFSKGLFVVLPALFLLAAVRPVAAAMVEDAHAPSLVIGANGRGVLAFRDRMTGRLMIGQCQDSDCTTVTSTAVDTMGPYGDRLDLAMGPSGPVIVYEVRPDPDTRTVKLALCADAACSSASTVVLAPGLPGNGVAVAIGSDARPLVAFDAEPSAGINQTLVSHCDNAACSAVSTTLIGEGEGRFGLDIAIGGDGLGVVAHVTFDVTTHVTHCANLACTVLTRAPLSGGTNSRSVRGVPYQGEAYPSLAIGTDLAALPVLAGAHRVFLLENAFLRRCQSSTCDPYTEQPLQGRFGPTSLAIDASNLPRIVVTQQVQDGLDFIGCLDAGCTQVQSTCLTAMGARPSLVLDGANVPLVAYEIGDNVAVGRVPSSCGPVVTVGSDSVVESAGPAFLEFTVRVGPHIQTPFTIDYATQDGSAQAGSDYVSASGTLTITPLQGSGVIRVEVLPDVVAEPAETLSVVLSNASGGTTIVDGEALGTIFDDGDMAPVVNAVDCAVIEGDTGAAGCLFEARLSAPYPVEATVQYATMPGTATAGVDYLSHSGTLTFPPGSVAGTASVEVIGDASVEPDETFALVLSNPVNARPGDMSGDATILDDDAPSLSSLELTHGSTVTADLAASGPVADEDRYRLAQAPFASYEAILDALSGDASPGATLERLAADGSTVLQTGTATGTGTARSLRFQNRLPAPVLGQYVRVGNASCGTACEPQDTYRLRLYETTGVIARFNNLGGQVTVLLLQNPTSSAITAHADFWDAGGARVSTQAATLAPHSVLVLNTAALSPLAGASGSITVSHDGGYGALAGKAVALEPATGFSFDSPLEYRPR